jgi:hypothetical protein
MVIFPFLVVYIEGLHSKEFTVEILGWVGFTRRWHFFGYLESRLVYRGIMIEDLIEQFVNGPLQSSILWTSL